MSAIALVVPSLVGDWLASIAITLTLAAVLVGGLEAWAQMRLPVIARWLDDRTGA